MAYSLVFRKQRSMASGPIISWEIDGETVETVLDFMFWGSQITADGGNSVRLCFGAPKSLQMVTAAMKLKDTYSLEGKL